MNKIAACLLFLAILFNMRTLSAEEARLEFRSAAFFHSSKLFRHIYGRVNADYQIQATTNFSDNLEFWANFSGFSKHGRSIGFKDPTRFTMANSSVGINILFDVSCKLKLYCGLGPCYARTWLKIKSGIEKQRITKNAYGVVFKTGIYYSVTDCIFIDLFVDYIRQPLHYENHVDIGGLKPGLGIGVQF
jgi:hypothetical protein